MVVQAEEEEKSGIPTDLLLNNEIQVPDEVQTVNLDQPAVPLQRFSLDKFEEENKKVVNEPDQLDEGEPLF